MTARLTAPIIITIIAVLLLAAAAFSPAEASDDLTDTDLLRTEVAALHADLDELRSQTDRGMASLAAFVQAHSNMVLTNGGKMRAIEADIASMKATMRSAPQKSTMGSADLDEELSLRIGDLERVDMSHHRRINDLEGYGHCYDEQAEVIYHCEALDDASLPR